jgi:hypothetical protein
MSADLLDAGMAWLAKKLERHAAKAVEYRRGAASVEVYATIGQTLLKLGDGYGGTRMEWTDRDYLIPAAKLVLGGVQVEPQMGDTVRETMGDEVFVYEVLAPAGEPAWRWSDPHRRMLRVHAKHIGTEPVVHPLGPPLPGPDPGPPLEG